MRQSRWVDYAASFQVSATSELNSPHWTEIAYFVSILLTNFETLAFRRKGGLWGGPSEWGVLQGYCYWCQLPTQLDVHSAVDTWWKCTIFVYFCVSKKLPSEEPGWRVLLAITQSSYSRFWCLEHLPLLVYDMCEVLLFRCAESFLSLRHLSVHRFLDTPMCASVCWIVCCTRLWFSSEGAL